MKNLFINVIIIIAFSSCASTNLVHISVLQPAPVTLPPYIKNVVVVNRTEVSKKSKVFNVIDKAVSLESPNLDKEGSQATITGLSDELKKNNRFDEVTLLTNSGLTTDAPGMFPAPLPWDLIEKYCSDNNADALFSLELFDTKSQIDYSVNKTTIKTVLGNVPAIEQQANMHTIVNAGWRIYEVRGKNILDEASINRTITFHARGINPLLAAQALTDRREAVKEVGNVAGHDYAFNIIPLWVRVTRDYYVRGSASFKIATRKARTGNWDGAAKLWQAEVNNPKRKIAGRACYNMAIINEINGDVDSAIQWAQKAYENYNNHLALSYVNILKNRKIDDVILEDQQPR
ncbi:tetratricopeptide repeat protein [Ginsengibacter hankyongi]|uniref:Tetratricopeptide repeat protein n=1 Tax=Ginsengibacter hankyongi TaxID=2607284 RepID=A0A5J5IET3_9BACT|nr:DUF6340 family protein [Ginsengibacter hankyongi]KAA9038123.1 tetratricopeptide repeat protein [Ginsengibacter hankyongi]